MWHAASPRGGGCPHRAGRRLLVCSVVDGPDIADIAAADIAADFTNFGWCAGHVVDDVHVSHHDHCRPHDVIHGGPDDGPLARPPYVPTWLSRGRFTGPELEQMLRGYIEAVMERYRGRIHTYIVVEDAPVTAEELATDVFAPAFGDEYVDLAFAIARETDPTAVLVYNADDNETLTSPASSLTHTIVSRLKSKGLIDAVGMEMHLDASDAPSRAEVIAAMRSYGLPVYVTEIDVDLSSLGGTTEERWAVQAQVYADMIGACIESGVCRSFSVWGIGDRFSWLERSSTKADPTLFDDDLQAKPAYEAVISELQ